MQSSAIPGARFVDPTVLARIGKLDLLARTVVDGFINGLHRAPFFGASIDFAEHRGYVPGDDIRRVDWKLFARTDRFYIKQYEADTNTNQTGAQKGKWVEAWKDYQLPTMIRIDIDPVGEEPWPSLVLAPRTLMLR